MSDFPFSSVLLGRVCKKVRIFLYSGSSKTGAHQVIAAALCVQQFLSLLFQVTGLSCELCSGAHAGGGLLNSYQSFLWHLMVQPNPFCSKCLESLGSPWMRVRAIWQQNVKEKMKKRSIKIMPLLVRKAEDRLRGEILRFTQQLFKCFQRPLKCLLFAKCYSSLFLHTWAVVYHDQRSSVLLTEASQWWNQLSRNVIEIRWMFIGLYFSDSFRKEG